MVQHGLSAEELMAQDAIELPEREMMQRFESGIIYLPGVALIPPPFTGVIGLDPVNPPTVNLPCQPPVDLFDTPVQAFTTHTTVVDESNSSFLVACQSVHVVNTSPGSTASATSVQDVNQ